jgi:hypothetical protein
MFKMNTNEHNRTGSGWRLAHFGVMLALAAGVGAIAGVVHAPVLDARALTFDDGQYVTHNKLVQDPSWESTRRFLTEVRKPSTVDGYYQPLTMISLMLDWARGGSAENLRPFHETNLALHIANTILLMVLLWSLFGGVWPAARAGLLYGVHPLTVEPIAWVGERKTLLTTFFALWCLVLHVRFARSGWWWVYGASFAAYVLAVLSKPTSTPLPLLVLLLDVWPLRRFSSRAVAETSPFFCVMAAAAIVTVWSQWAGVGLAVRHEFEALDYVLIGCHNIVFYLLKMVWPVGLTQVHPFPSLELSDPVMAVGIGGTIAIAAAMLVSLRWTRAAAIGMLMFGVMLAPTILNADYSWGIASEKYVYLPAIGLMVLVAWAIGRAMGGRERTEGSGLRTEDLGVRTQDSGLRTEEDTGRRAASGTQGGGHGEAFDDARVPRGAVATGSAGGTPAGSDTAVRGGSGVRVGRVAVVAVLVFGAAGAYAMQTRRQLTYWRDTLALRQHLVDSAPDDPRLRINLGVALAEAGRTEEAMEQYREAARRDATDPALLNNVAWELATHPTEAYRDGPRAVAFAEEVDRVTGGRWPMFVDTLAAAYAEAGRFEEAVRTQERAIAGAMKEDSKSDEDEIKGFRERLELFKQGKPYRDPDLARPWPF